MNNLGAIFPRLQRVGSSHGGTRRVISENGSYLRATGGRTSRATVRARAVACMCVCARVYGGAVMVIN